LNPSPDVARRMLLAGHIKPWQDSSAAERLDPRDGLAACPSRDVAFDTGMLTVTADLKIHIA
jgi:putative restriction endonuclease